MACPLGAIHATPCLWHKLRVPLIERSEFENEQDIRLNPELEIADGEKDASCLLPCPAPILSEASGERLFLLVGLKFGQQERMADADLFTVEGFDHDGRTRGDLLDAVLRRFQKEQRTEALRLLHRVNVAPHEIFNQLRLQHLGIGEVLDANGHGGDFGHLRGAVTPCAEDDLEAAFTGRPYKQGR